MLYNFLPVPPLPAAQPDHFSESGSGDVLIDVHTHFYPDAIADKTIRALQKEGEFVACCDGTAASLRRFMHEDGVSISLNLPVATRNDQVRGINRKMIEFNRTGPGDVVCFGCMHPRFREVGDVAEEIGFLAANGVKGIKLHPEYQDFDPDDPALADIYEACRDFGLVILFHAGFDFPNPGRIRALPEKLKAVTTVPGLKMIFAHLGGYRMSGAVLRHLAGTGAWFDTAYTHELEDSVLRAVIDRHGEDKILFGSDFPWARAGVIRRKIENAFPDPEVRERIFHRNAELLLGLQAPHGA